MSFARQARRRDFRESKERTLRRLAIVAQRLDQLRGEEVLSHGEAYRLMRAQNYVEQLARSVKERRTY